MAHPYASSSKLSKGITWFKACLAISCLIGAISLLTPYPARLVEAWHGTPQETITPTVSPTTGITPTEVVAPVTPPPLPPAPVAEPLIKFVDKIIEIPALPRVEYPPFPPVLAIKPGLGKFTHIGEFARGMNLKTEVAFTPGSTAAVDRKDLQNYQATISINIKQPYAATSASQIAANNPHLPKMLKDFSSLISRAQVSPFYGQIYKLKQNRLRQDLASLAKPLDRHNFYDTDTILEIEHPASKRKALWIQADMDVVSDGSDGDRLGKMPESILSSDYYQPTTSYRWKKIGNKPNPLVSPWEKRLASYRAALPKASAADKAALNGKIDHAQRVIAELKSYSFLISEYDPFIVIPLGVLNQSSPYSPGLGDYVAVIAGDKILPAIVGDAGPRYKAGEASLRISKALNPKASPNARPISALSATYIVFPGTASATPSPPDYQAWHAAVTQYVDELGGLHPNYTLHQWSDNLAPKPTPPSPTPAPPAPTSE